MPGPVYSAPGWWMKLGQPTGVSVGTKCTGCSWVVTSSGSRPASGVPASSSAVQAPAATTTWSNLIDPELVSTRTPDGLSRSPVAAL